MLAFSVEVASCYARPLRLQTNFVVVTALSSVENRNRPHECQRVRADIR